MALTLGTLGFEAFIQGNSTAELPSIEEGLALFRELGDRRNSARMLCFLGYAAFVQEDYAKARAYYEEALTTFRELGDKWFIALCLEGLAAVAVAQGQPAWAAGQEMSLEHVLTEQAHAATAEQTSTIPPSHRPPAQRPSQRPPLTN